METETTGDTLLSRSPAKTIRVFNYPQILSQSVEAESSLEGDFVGRVVLYSQLKILVSQPFVLPVSPNGYTPDFFAKTESGKRYVVEIKVDRKVKKYAELFDKAAAYLRPKGIDFIVVTEKHIRRARIQKRALRLLRYLKAQYLQSTCDAAIADVKANPCGVTIGKMIKRGFPRELIFHLVAMRKLTTGTRLMLDDSALIFLPNTKETDDENSLARWLGVTPWGEDL